jgi:hypothetical protein
MALGGRDGDCGQEVPGFEPFTREDLHETLPEGWSSSSAA